MTATKKAIEIKTGDIYLEPSCPIGTLNLKTNKFTKANETWILTEREIIEVEKVMHEEYDFDTRTDIKVPKIIVRWLEDPGTKFERICEAWFEPQEKLNIT